jgi:hypothetical protein
MPSSDIKQLEKQLLKRDKIERRSGPKPVRLSNLIAQTAWLDGEPLWREGRVLFQIGEKLARIEEEDIRRTNRALERLATRDLRRELVDMVAIRRRKLEYLREIATLEALDLKTLCSVSRRQNPRAIERLGQLLIVESLNPELLDYSPTRALIQAWPLSQNILETLAKSEKYPDSTRELARYALANRHFEFWQKNPNFPVALCTKLGLTGYGMPDQLEKSGPYSLSYSQIFHLYQSGFSADKVFAIVDTMRQIPCVWLDSQKLKLAWPHHPKVTREIAAEYKSYATAFDESIGEFFLTLAKNDLDVVLPAAKFLIFWQWRWYSTFLSLRKKSGNVRVIREACEVFKAAFSILKPLENNENAKAIIEVLQVKTRGFIGQTASLDSHLKSLKKLKVFSDFAHIVGVERAKDLGYVDLGLLKYFSKHSKLLELALNWAKLCEGENHFFWELENAHRKGASLSILHQFGKRIEKHLLSFSPSERSYVFDYALEGNWSHRYAQILSEIYRKYTDKIVAFNVKNHRAWLSIFSSFAQNAQFHQWSVEKALLVFDVVFESLKGHADWSKEVECAFDMKRVMQYMASLCEFEDYQSVELFRDELGQAIEWSKTHSSNEILWNLEPEMAFSLGKRKGLRRALLASVRRTPRFLFETLPQFSSLKRLHLLDKLKSNLYCEVKHGIAFWLVILLLSLT